jgi:hypothetical protein
VPKVRFLNLGLDFFPRSIPHHPPWKKYLPLRYDQHVMPNPQHPPHVGILRPLGCPKTRIHFTNAEGSGGYCESLARGLYHQRVFDWLDDSLAKL